MVSLLLAASHSSSKVSFRVLVVVSYDLRVLECGLVPPDGLLLSAIESKEGCRNEVGWTAVERGMSVLGVCGVRVRCMRKGTRDGLTKESQRVRKKEKKREGEDEQVHKKKRFESLFKVMWDERDAAHETGAPA